jgi:hypothetical protein
MWKATLAPGPRPEGPAGPLLRHVTRCRLGFAARTCGCPGASADPAEVAGASLGAGAFMLQAEAGKAPV